MLMHIALQASLACAKNKKDSYLERDLGNTVLACTQNLEKGNFPTRDIATLLYHHHLIRKRTTPQTPKVANNNSSLTIVGNDSSCMLLCYLVEWEAEGCYKDEGRKVLIKRLASHKKTEDYKKVFDFCKEIAQQQSYDVFGIGSQVINFNDKAF